MITLLLLCAISLKDFGAVGDGVHDDTEAIQACFHHAAENSLDVFVPRGIYRCNSVFLYGAVSVCGESSDHCKFVSTDELTYRRWFNVGYDRYGDNRGDTWTGKLQGLTFEARGDLTEMVHVARSKDAKVYDCRFTGHKYVTGRLLALGYNNAAYLNDGGVTPKDGITVSECVFDCTGAEHSHESVGAGDDYKNVKILNNTIILQPDDLGIHRCENVLISGNHITATDGRILATDSRNVTISDNILEYVDTEVAGMGIAVFCESWRVPRVPTNYTITGNQIHYRGKRELRSIGYGIRIQAGRKIVIANNIASSDSPINGLGLISIETQRYPQWIDPDGIDPDGQPRLRDVVVSNNIAESISIQNHDNEGPIILSSNIAGSISDLDLRGAVTYSGNTFKKVGAIQPTHKTNATFVEGQSWAATSHSRLLRTLSETAGTVTVKVNGVERFKIVLRSDGEGGYVGYFGNAYNPAALVDKGDKLQLDGVASPILVVVCGR